ncbi:hypothetical protein [Azotobacter salinestris]|nr:hypothetical protein [Azotobacter salinestris]
MALDQLRPQPGGQAAARHQRAAVRPLAGLGLLLPLLIAPLFTH